MNNRNPVCRFAHKFNKSIAFADRKRKAKNGYSKHKKNIKFTLDK